MRRWEGLPYWLILPAVAYLVLFFAWPMVEAFELAFRENDHWTLDAFRTMVDDVRFGEALSFTLILIAVIVPLQFVLALAMALIVNARLSRTRPLPLHLPAAARDLRPRRGHRLVVDLHRARLPEHDAPPPRAPRPGAPAHLARPDRQDDLLGTIVVAEIWRSTALIMIILVAGLQSIPREFGEAAEVFGAGFFQRLWHVTLPMLKPSIQVALLLRIILAFEVFATVIAIAGEGTTVLSAEAYRWENTIPERERRGRIRHADPRPVGRVGPRRAPSPAHAKEQLLR